MFTINVATFPNYQTQPIIIKNYQTQPLGIPVVNNMCGFIPAITSPTEENSTNTAPASSITSVDSPIPFSPRATLPSEARYNICKWFDEFMINQDVLIAFMKDKEGSLLIQNLLMIMTKDARQKFCSWIFETNFFYKHCDHKFSNYVFQRMIETADDVEENIIVNLLAGRLCILSYGEYSSRIVQRVFQVFRPEIFGKLIANLKGKEVGLSMDQHGNHVIQIIIQHAALCDFLFIIEGLVKSPRILVQLISHKYGCHVMERAIERLERYAADDGDETALANIWLQQILSMILTNLNYCISHEHANYLVQYIISSKYLQNERNIIIIHIMRKVLKLSLERHASHVVERALIHAPPLLYPILMDEFFDGDCKNALQLLLFDQYGNYVVQTILALAIETRNGERVGRSSWFESLSKRINSNKHKLIHYSSGTKILELLEKANKDKNVYNTLPFGCNRSLAHALMDVIKPHE